MAPVRPKPGGSPARFGKPSKGNRKRGKGIRKGIKGKPFRELGLFNRLRRSGAKTRFSPLSPGAAPRGARSATGPLYPWFLIIARKIRALIALAVVGKELGVGGGGRRHQGVMAGLVPAIHEGPAHRRRQARKALRPSPSCRSRRGGIRSCGGPAWMAGTSPAMTARVRRTNSKPVDQQITP